MRTLPIILFAFFISLAGCAQEANLSVAEFNNAITTNKIQLLDVRTAGEYNNGHLDKAFLADWTNKDQFRSRITALDKTIPVYTYCLSGARSDAAAKWMRENGFTVYNMAGGINAWKKAGLPVVQLAVVPQTSLAAYLSSIPADKTVLVDFGAEWCPPCKKMEPVLNALVKEEGSKFQFIKVDGGTQTTLVNELNISGFPTFIIYKGGKEVWRKEGLVEKAALLQQL